MARQTPGHFINSHCQAGGPYPSASFAWAAAKRATGTPKGEQLTSSRPSWWKQVMEHIQDGVGPYPEAEGVVEMGGRGTGDEDHMVTEASIRSFYKYYREVMGL